MRERVVLPHLTPSEIPETMVNEATHVLEWSSSSLQLLPTMSWFFYC